VTRHLTGEALLARPGSVASFIPDNPVRPGGRQALGSLRRSASRDSRGPVFGGQEFPRYREMRGRVTHPGRLDEVILSAPSTFPVPDPGIPWPHGMATARIHEGIGSGFTPDPIGWLTAASTVSVTVLAGSRDTEQRPPAPGQEGSTRIGRATAWVESMRRHAQASKITATIRFVMAEGFDHDEEAMAVPAQKILAQRWRAAAESPD
jgi:hypothetical protein